MNPNSPSIPEAQSIRPHELIYGALSKMNSKVTLEIPIGVAWQHFDGISDVQEFVARAASRYGCQGTVQEFGDCIVVELG